MENAEGQSAADSKSKDPKYKMLSILVRQSTVKQPARDNSIPQHSNHLKHTMKSKSLDLFDRPSNRLHLKRFMSLSNMFSIPEDSCFPSSMHPFYTDDDMKVNHRSPVSIENGYRPSASIGNHASK